MIARPVVAGRVYSVRFRGADVLILAVNPCDALCEAIERLEAA